MPKTHSQVVITGLGVVSPAGLGVEEFFGALLAGRSGLVRPPEGHPAGGATDALGLAPPIDPKTVLPRTEARFADRFLVLALAAAAEAITDAGLVLGGNADPDRTGVVVGSGAGGLATYETQAVRHHERGRAAVSAYLYPSFLPNMASARIAIAYGIRGYSSSMSTACAAGAHAIADAFRLIRDGDADVVICGGAESPLGGTGVSGFATARALAGEWADPRDASRPFDRRRNGFVLGEGAGVLVLESAAHADARGARSYADVVGWGATTDAFHPTNPRPDGAGAAAAMRNALTSAGLETGDIGYINAHGTSTKLGDAAEAKAIRNVFGDHTPAVSSTKGVTGHLLGAAGAVEAAATALALSRGALPPTLNLEDPDPDCDVDHVRKAPRTGHVAYALSNSFAFGGHNVSLVFGPPTGGRPRGAA